MAFRRDAYALKGRSKIAPHALNQRSPAEGKAKSVWELKKAKKKESVCICGNLWDKDQLPQTSQIFTKQTPEIQNFSPKSLADMKIKS